MSDDLTILTISATISVIIGVILAYAITWFGNLWNEQKLRKKYSRVFSYELQQLQSELDQATSPIRESLLDPDGTVYDFTLEERWEQGLYAPEDILPDYHFKSDYAFLRQNFEKIAIFQENTIKSLIKINSLIEEYDNVSKNDTKTLLTRNLEVTQKEIKNALNLLQKEENRGMFRFLK